MFHYLPRFDGSFENIFDFNDLGYFNDLQSKLEAERYSFKGYLIKVIIIYELFRINMGFKDFREIEKLFRFAPQLSVFGLPMCSSGVPSAADMSYVLKKLPQKAIFQFFLDLVDECVACGIIIPKILICDGQFIRTNSNNN